MKHFSELMDTLIKESETQCKNSQTEFLGPGGIDYKKPTRKTKEKISGIVQKRLNFLLKNK